MFVLFRFYLVFFALDKTGPERTVRREVRTRHPDDVRCEGVTYEAVGVNDRSITRPRVVLTT